MKEQQFKYEQIKFVIAVMFGMLVFVSSAQEATKLKHFKLKYTLPNNWLAEEFGDKTNWEKAQSSLCNCAGVRFTKQHSNGKLNVVIYPSSQSGLDSIKRNFVGPLHFENVEKYDKTKNKFFSFEKRKSNFTDIQSKAKSYDVIRYFTKVDDCFYIIYAWQENLLLMSPQIEKELYEMVNSLEPL